MIIDGATIYNEGVDLGHDCEKKIRQIMTAVKTVSPSSQVSMRLLKSNKFYEVMLWGKADSLPIGVYNRGASLSHLLDNVLKNVQKQCLKAKKEVRQYYRQGGMALAG